MSQGGLEVGAEPPYGARPDPERARERGKVRADEVDAERRVAGQLLVKAKHPVAAVVDEDHRERDLRLRDGGQLAAGEQEPAVATDAHRGPDVGKGGAERCREGEPQRPHPIG